MWSVWTHKCLATANHVQMSENAHTNCLFCRIPMCSVCFWVTSILVLHDLYCNVRMFFVFHTKSLLLHGHCHITSKLHCVVEAHAMVYMHKLDLQQIFATDEDLHGWAVIPLFISVTWMLSISGSYLSGTVTAFNHQCESQWMGYFPFDIFSSVCFHSLCVNSLQLKTLSTRA